MLRRNAEYRRGFPAAKLEVNMETEFIPVTNIDITVPKTDIPKSDSFSAEPDNTAEKLRTLADHIENCDL